MTDTRTVSSRYARNDFTTIGLVLTLYALIVFFVPVVLGYFVDLYNVVIPHFSDTALAVRLVCLLIGTLLPFGLLSSSVRKKKRDDSEEGFGFLDYVLDLTVFFTVYSASVFLANTIAIFFHLKGSMVGGIGIGLTDENLNSFLYVLSFVLVTPVLEEYAFRGALLKSLSRYGKYFAVYTGPLVYALAHFSFIEMIPAFAMGHFLSKVALKYKSVFPAVALHVSVNLLLYGVFVAPSFLTPYVFGVLALVYLMAIYLVISRIYIGIRVRRMISSGTAFAMFFSTPAVLLALVLLVVSSVLSIYLFI